MLPILLNFIVSCIVIFITDRIALPTKDFRESKISQTYKDFLKDAAARICVIILVYAGFFAISWRPYYSMQGTISFYIVFAAISRVKFNFIREPLIFSDIAMVGLLLRNKNIFYAKSIDFVFWSLSFFYIFGVTTLYFIFEPSILPHENAIFWILAMGFIAYGLPTSLILLRVGKPLTKEIEGLLRTLDPKINTVRFGAFGSITFHFLIWLGHNRETALEKIRQSFNQMDGFLRSGDVQKPHETHSAPLVIVWQSESFIDLRHFGVADLDLPNLDALKTKAIQWGRLTNVFEGGYTLRTEFSVLTGLNPDEAHIDASYPYLKASSYSSVAWPKKLLDAGWSTHFVHPFDGKFFNRDKAMPQLGFQSMTMLEEFEHVPGRDGLYVSDRKLTKKVVEMAISTDECEPGLIFVGSMANHGPWEYGRCGILSDNVEIYKELLRKADEALGLLVNKLKHQNRPILLVFYGDHAPLLKSFADPFPDPRTDYVIAWINSQNQLNRTMSSPKEENPWNILHVALNQINKFYGSIND